MCKVYNPVGSLTAVKSHLQRNQIHDFQSLNEVMAFQKNYSTQRQQIISAQERAMEQEKTTLQAELPQLDLNIQAEKLKRELEIRQEIDQLERQMSDLVSSAPNGFLQRIRKFFRVRHFKKRVRDSEFNFEYKVSQSVQSLKEEYNAKNNRYQYLVSQFSDTVYEGCFPSLQELERKKRAIDEVGNSIYGALGEQQVVKALENLSDDYFLINDFSLYFPKALYYRQENEYIQSIQIDHLLIAPSGIFLIETKNWSEQSLQNLSLRSPVEQIRRTSFAVFKMLSEGIGNASIGIHAHHWGTRKIPVRNLIVLTGSKPSEEFQFVKILTVTELTRYITYFKPAFSGQETAEIANFFLNLIRQN